MADQTPVQTDDAGALDLNKLPEMQQQPIPDGDGEHVDESSERPVILKDNVPGRRKGG